MKGAKAMCPKCERGPFCLTPKGTIRKHACWTKQTEADVFTATVKQENALREVDWRAEAPTRKRAALRQHRLDRWETLKFAMLTWIPILITLGSCH